VLFVGFIKEDDMKSEIFSHAIQNRQLLRFVYNGRQLTVEPVFIGTEPSGAKVVYARPISTRRIEKYPYRQIFNIRTLNVPAYAPVLPLASIYSGLRAV